MAGSVPGPPAGSEQLAVVVPISQLLELTVALRDFPALKKQVQHQQDEIVALRKLHQEAVDRIGELMSLI